VQRYANDSFGEFEEFELDSIVTRSRGWIADQFATFTNDDIARMILESRPTGVPAITLMPMYHPPCIAMNDDVVQQLPMPIFQRRDFFLYESMAALLETYGRHKVKPYKMAIKEEEPVGKWHNIILEVGLAEANIHTPDSFFNITQPQIANPGAHTNNQ